MTSPRDTGEGLDHLPLSVPIHFTGMSYVHSEVLLVV